MQIQTTLVGDFLVRLRRPDEEKAIDPIATRVWIGDSYAAIYSDTYCDGPPLLLGH